MSRYFSLVSFGCIFSSVSVNSHKRGVLVCKDRAILRTPACNHVKPEGQRRENLRDSVEVSALTANSVSEEGVFS